MMSSGAGANILNGIGAPLPTIDLDEISRIVAETYDQLAPNYKPDDILTRPLQTFDSLLKRSPNRGRRVETEILDIGCGSGWEVHSFLTARSFRVTGIDLSQEMINVAHRNTPSGDFRQMKMHDLQFAEARFDAIWSARTLVHVPGALVVDLLHAWKRILKPGGILCVSVVIGDQDGWEQEEDAPDWFMYNRYFADGEIEGVLEAVGYHVLRDQVIEVVEKRHSRDFNNHFVFAQKPATRLAYEKYREYIRKDEESSQWIDSVENLKQAIALHLQAGTLAAREQVNLCILYDHLAQRYKANADMYRVIAWKLKLHLQTPETLLSEDFDVWFTLGCLHLKLTQFQQAMLCFNRALLLRPDHIATLLRLGFCYDGLRKFDQAIETTERARQLAEKQDISPEEMADLYHALGHFYIDRSHDQDRENFVGDRKRGEDYMVLACGTGKDRYAYLSCLASIYNETKRYADTVSLIDNSINEKKIRDNAALYNELHFYRGEAYMCTDRYEDALLNLQHVETYAKNQQDWDALAHVKFYEVRAALRQKNVSDLSLTDLRLYLQTLYDHEPSLYVFESFRRSRKRLIGILSAFYLLKQCLETQEEYFSDHVLQAIAYMEKMYNDEQEQSLDILILVDELIDVHTYQFPAPVHRHLYRFDEIGSSVAEPDLERYHVWGVLVFQNAVTAEKLARISFALGQFCRKAYTIYVYDPHTILPDMIRKTLTNFYVDSIEDLCQFCYVMLLYDKSREFLASTRTPYGIAPIREAPALLTSQAEVINLLPLL